MTVKISISAIAVAATFASFIAATSSHAAGKSCVMAGGEATMITGDLAQFMAKAALGNSIKKMDATPTGAIMLKCNDPAPLTYCLAKQRACK